MAELFFENVKTKKRYKVVTVDKVKSEITLRGEYGEFTEKYDKDRFTRLGYVLVQGKQEDQEQAA